MCQNLLQLGCAQRFPFAVQADNREGYDALTESSDGRELALPLGHEQAESGPTTNFVGNHMTQVTVPRSWR